MFTTSRKFWRNTVYIGIVLSGCFALAGKTMYIDKDGRAREAQPEDYKTMRQEAITTFKQGNIDITVSYQDVDQSTGIGFDDPTLGAERRATLESVLAYITGLMDNTGALEVQVNLSETDGTGAIASAGPYFNADAGFVDGYPMQHITTGVDPNTGFPDMVVNVVDFGYNLNGGLGTPANNEVDLYSVLLHEITHGLGLISFGNGDGSSQVGSTFSRFDGMLYTSSGTRLWNESGSFTATAADLVGTNGAVEFRGSNAMANYGSAPPVYTPNPFAAGSSLGHWAFEVGSSIMLAQIVAGATNRTYTNLELGALADLGYSVSTTNYLVYPWVSNSNDFESTVVANNPGTSAVTATFTARRADGSSEESDPVLIPAYGFFQQKASELFGDLGTGPGYTVTMEVNSPLVTGRWVTNDRASETPSQGVAIRIPNGVTDRVGSAIMLGYLPGNANFQSAPVVVNLGDSATDITVYFFNESGTLVNQLESNNAAPLIPKVITVVNATAGDQYAVAVSSSSLITGACFVFNSLNQTAIGNSSSISSFTPPSN